MSTATEAQRDRILQALTRRPHTSYDLRRLGIYQAPARVKELRDRFGYGITTDLITLVDRDGYWHARCALYTLVSLPMASAKAFDKGSPKPSGNVRRNRIPSHTKAPELDGKRPQ